MAKKKLFRTDKNADATRKAKPLGYRYKNLDPMDSRYFKRPTTEEIAKFHAGDKKMKRIIAFEDRPERSDKNQKNKLGKGGSIDIQFPNSNLYLVGEGLDTNGNYIVKVTFPNQRAFAIQTNGVLPRTQNNLKSVEKISELTEEQILEIEKEVVDYVYEHGSTTQKSKLKTYSGFDKRDVAEASTKTKTISGVKHSIMKGEVDYYDMEELEPFSHPLGAVYSDGKYGYVPTGYAWLRFDIKDLDRIKSRMKDGGSVKEIGIDWQSDFDSEEKETIEEDVQNRIADMVEEGYTSGELNGQDPDFSGWWEITIEEDEEDEDTRNKEVARLIRNGNTSGYSPTWSYGANVWHSKSMKQGGSVKRSKASIKQDKSIKALHGGKRISTDGNIYYENRVNRSDADRRLKLERGGKVGGRGFFGLEKGKKITNMNQLEKDAIILTHSSQFNANNTLKVVGKRQYGKSYVVFDTIYWDAEKNKRIGNEEMSISKNNLTWDEYYLPKNSGVRSYKERRGSVLAKAKKIKGFKE